MTSITEQLRELFQAALQDILGPSGQGVDPLLRPAADAKFGDYQSNVAMSLAKKTGDRPRDLAERIVQSLKERSPAILDTLEVAGPGFINIRLSDGWLADSLNAVPAIPDTAAADRLGLAPARDPQTVVVDYSSPNVAKQMHVGHLRSTIIGDAFARVLEFEGHRVIRQNHIGDWGTQFGMLIAYLKQEMPDALDPSREVHVADLEAFYRQANALAASDPEFQKTARAEVVALHAGEPSALKAWQFIVGESRRHYLAIYQKLGVSLTEADERGESFYNDRLAPLVADLKKRFAPSDTTKNASATPQTPRVTVEESDGAICVFHCNADGEPMFTKPDGDPLPMIIRKSDGAFLYATTDLAAMQFRVEQLGVDRIIYVTDARQAQHFEMVFAAARGFSWTHRQGKGEVRLDHASFGSILGTDRRPLKTRTGENIKLADLLGEAVSRAEQLIRTNEADPAKRRGFSEDEIADIAEAVGIGAVKYADLCQNRQSDYVFSWDKMLAMEGNTAPYLMYAYARIRSICRKGSGMSEQVQEDTAASADSQAAPDGLDTVFKDPAERALALQLCRFAETIDSVAGGLRVNMLTDYLYDLSGAFMKFYECCPVLSAETAIRKSRWGLCDLTSRVLRIGLGLLGIRVVERM